MNYKKILIFLTLLLWPYFFLFPISADILTIGNDFELLYFSYKKYIFELVSSGIIPLWSPSEGAGFPLILNPFAQFFYPLSWTLYLFYKIFDTFTTYHFALYTIFAISIFNFGQFFWLRKLNFNIYICLVSTLVVTMSLKFTELLRFPNALHTVCWMPWILYSIILLKEKKKKFKSFTILFFSIFSLLTAGYPYFIFYIFLICFFYYIYETSCSLLEKKFHKYIVVIPVLAVVSSTFFLLPYFYKIYEMLQLMNRAESSYYFSTAHSFKIYDILGSFFFPPAASTEGRFYFGSISTLIFFLIIFIKLFYSSLLNNKQKYIYPLLFFIIFIINLSMSKDSFLFNIIYENIPFIKYIRTWPRINILLVPAFSLMLAVAIDNLLYIKSSNKFLPIHLNKIYYFILFYFISILLLQTYFVYFDITNTEYWDIWQKKRFTGIAEILQFPFREYVLLHSSYVYSIYLFLSVIFLIIILRKKIIFFNILFGIFFLSSLELFLFSNLQWALPSGFYKSSNTIIEPISKLQKGFSDPRISNEVHGFRYFRDNGKFNINYYEDWGFSGHHLIYKKYFDLKSGLIKQELSKQEKVSAKYFFGMDNSAKKFFFSKTINHNSLLNFTTESREFEKISLLTFNVILENYNGNSVELFYDTKEDSVLSFIDNWDSNWTATIDGKKVEIKKLFGAYKAIEAPAGKHKVIFSYKLY